MPANVIKLEEVVPGLNGTDIEAPDGKTYHIPGDLPTATVFKMLALFEELVTFEQRSADSMAKSASAVTIKKIREDLETVTGRINDELLAIFQITDPKLTELPFGSRSTAVILTEVFKALGLASDGGVQELPNPPQDPPARGGRKGGRSQTTSRSTPKAGSRKAEKKK